MNEVNSFLFWTARCWRTWHLKPSCGGEPQRCGGCLLKQIPQHRECRGNSPSRRMSTSVAKCDNRNVDKRHSVEHRVAWGKSSSSCRSQQTLKLLLCILVNKYQVTSQTPTNGHLIKLVFCLASPVLWEFMCWNLHPGASLHTAATSNDSVGSTSGFPSKAAIFA